MADLVESSVTIQCGERQMRVDIKAMPSEDAEREIKELLAGQILADIVHEVVTGESPFNAPFDA